MFVLMGKIITPLIAPLGLSFALWLASALCSWNGRRRLGKWLGRAGAGVLLAFSSPLIGERLLGELEDDYPILSVEDCPPADAIVVLGGVTEPRIPPRQEVEVNPAFDRLLHGIRLLRAGKAPLLVLSGGAIPLLDGSEVPEAVQMEQLAQLCGVATEAILLEKDSRTTYENALFIRQLLQARGLKKVLLVTSAAHMRRAMGVFAQQGVEAIPAPTDVRVVSRPYRFLQFLPTLWGLECSTWAAKEYVGWWVYWLRGWID